MARCCIAMRIWILTVANQNTPWPPWKIAAGSAYTGKAMSFINPVDMTCIGRLSNSSSNRATCFPVPAPGAIWKTPLPRRTVKAVKRFTLVLAVNIPRHPKPTVTGVSVYLTESTSHSKTRTMAPTVRGRARFRRFPRVAEKRHALLSTRRRGGRRSSGNH